MGYEHFRILMAAFILCQAFDPKRSRRHSTKSLAHRGVLTLLHGSTRSGSSFNRTLPYASREVAEDPLSCSLL
uniref:Uncharacterized protein n=1 Tax=Monomastix sp. (strain OKE-1) TaxID=141716 RepID=U5YGE2_MONSK|nr:hypothetical protein [Monomastix sp. OKE-1]AGZ90185.1 hypothetical protein [Monomastix sp. OKE-1]